LIASQNSETNNHMKTSRNQVSIGSRRITAMEFSRLVSAAVLALILAGSASAQVSLTGPNYPQDFNAIGAGLPTGWTVRTNAGTNSLGTSATFNPTNSWGATSGEFRNCASTISNYGTNFNGGENTTIQRACTNRSLAVHQTGTFGNPGAAFVLQIANTLGKSNFNFSVDLNLLKSNGYSTTWFIEYAVGNSPASFTTMGVFPDPGHFGDTRQTFNLGTDANNKGSNVWIRFVALTNAVGGGTRDTFGLDNFVLGYNGLPPVRLSIEQMGANVVMRWTNAGFNLQSAPSITDTFTNVPGATSPYTNPAAGNRKFFRLKSS
jgi:hypothetical protein